MTGPRDWRNGWLVRSAIILFVERQSTSDPVTIIMEGGAPGVDRFASEAARMVGVPGRTFKADWNKYRKQRPNPAGAIRNRQMLKEGAPTFGLVFHAADNPHLLDHSGTADMARLLREAGIPYIHIRDHTDLERVR